MRLAQYLSLRTGYACLVAVLTLAACGGGSDNYSSPAATTPPPVAQSITVALSGDQEAPQPVYTAAIGTGTLKLTRETRTLSATVEVDGMTPTAAHIHAGVGGKAGAVVFPMTINGKVATLADTVLTTDQLAALDAGGFYINVHSAANPTGEIRGQIGREVYSAKLSGAQETNPVTSAATAVGYIILNAAASTISAEVDIVGVTATAAHIHNGAFGTNGAVLFPLMSHGTADHYGLDETKVTADQIASLRSGAWYFNVHSAANATGEIRGQIGRRILIANASGAQEVQANNSSATGRGFVVYEPATRKIAGQIAVVNLTGVAAHIHTAAAGSNGPVLQALDAPAAGTTTWTIPSSAAALTVDTAQALLSGGTYFNVHSAAFSTGEIRGQILAP